MLFVMLLKARPGTLQQSLARRMTWQFPKEGAEPVAEYWLQTPDPACVGVWKADHIGQIWATVFGWDDLFDISVYPATTAQEGLELLKQFMPMMQKNSRRLVFPLLSGSASVCEVQTMQSLGLLT